MPTFVIVFVLVVAWTAYGITVWLGRAERRNVNSISSFSNHLSVLERASPARAGFSTVDARPANTLGAAERESLVIGSPATGTPLTVSAAQRRRRDVLAGLAGASLFGLLVGGLLGGAFAWLSVLSVAAFGAYVVLLARRQSLAAEREAKVHFLPHTNAHDADDAYRPSYQAAYLSSAN